MLRRHGPGVRGVSLDGGKCSRWEGFVEKVGFKPEVKE